MVERLDSSSVQLSSDQNVSLESCSADCPESVPVPLVLDSIPVPLVLDSVPVTLVLEYDETNSIHVDNFPTTVVAPCDDDESNIILGEQNDHLCSGTISDSCQEKTMECLDSTSVHLSCEQMPEQKIPVNSSLTLTSSFEDRTESTDVISGAAKMLELWKTLIIPSETLKTTSSFTEMQRDLLDVTDSNDLTTVTDANDLTSAIYSQTMSCDNRGDCSVPASESLVSVTEEKHNIILPVEQTKSPPFYETSQLAPLKLECAYVTDETCYPRVASGLIESEIRLQKSVDDNLKVELVQPSLTGKSVTDSSCGIVYIIEDNEDADPDDIPQSPDVRLERNRNERKDISVPIKNIPCAAAIRPFKFHSSVPLDMECQNISDEFSDFKQAWIKPKSKKVSNRLLCDLPGNNKKIVQSPKRPFDVAMAKNTPPATACNAVATLDCQVINIDSDEDDISIIDAPNGDTIDSFEKKNRTQKTQENQLTKPKMIRRLSPHKSSLLTESPKRTLVVGMNNEPVVSNRNEIIDLEVSEDDEPKKPLVLCNGFKTLPQVNNKISEIILPTIRITDESVPIRIRKYAKTFPLKTCEKNVNVPLDMDCEDAREVSLVSFTSSTFIPGMRKSFYLNNGKCKPTGISMNNTMPPKSEAVPTLVSLHSKTMPQECSKSNQILQLKISNNTKETSGLIISNGIEIIDLDVYEDNETKPPVILNKISEIKPPVAGKSIETASLHSSKYVNTIPLEICDDDEAALFDMDCEDVPDPANILAGDVRLNDNDIDQENSEECQLPMSSDMGLSDNVIVNDERKCAKKTTKSSSGMKINAFKCSFCSKLCAGPFELRSHEKTHVVHEKASGGPSCNFIPFKPKMTPL